MGLLDNQFIQSKIEDVMYKIPDNYYDIVFTSPPYNIFKKGSFVYKDTTQSYVQKYDDYDDNIKQYDKWLFNIINTLLDKTEYFFLNIQSFAANKRELINLQYMLKDYYCDTIIWNKTNGIPNGFNERVMTNVFEYIHIYSKKNNSRSVGTKKWKGTVKNIIDINGNMNNKYSKIHKALFPIELPYYIFKNFVKENGKVLDCFAGLGTSALAADQLNLKWTMIEQSEDYIKISKERLKEQQNLNLE